MKHIVKISKQAFAQIILSGFEAFIIKHRDYKTSGIEFHAGLFGDIQINDSKSLWTHSVEFISASTSANMASGQVEFLPEAIDLKDDMAEQMGYYLLGTMHSHPYMRHEMSLDDVRKKGSDYSQSDLNLFSWWIDRYEPGRGYHLELLLTIKHIEKTNTQKDGRSEINLFEFSVGNCKCFLRAQIFTKNTHDQLNWAETELVCEYLDDGRHLEAAFGRIEPKAGKKRVLEYR